MSECFRLGDVVKARVVSFQIHVHSGVREYGHSSLRTYSSRLAMREAIICPQLLTSWV